MTPEAIHEDAGGSRWDEGNLQALCVKCHIAKTRRENSVFAMSPDQRAWLNLLTKEGEPD